MEEKRTDIAIIGGGPGGYVAAIKAGQLGLKVMLIEKGRLGGICLNVGCIPSKALIEASLSYERVKQLNEIGIKAVVEEVNWSIIQGWKEQVVNKLVNGVEQLCKANNVEVIKGEAEVSNLGELIVKKADEQIKVKYERLVIATGSYPVELAEVKYDHDKVLDSSDILSIKEIPGSLLVVGGGYIGLELGSILARFGSKVAVVEMLPQILPGLDTDVVRAVERELRKMGMEIFINSVVKRIEGGERMAVVIDTKGTERKVEVDKILVSVGRKPLVNGFGLDKIGIQLNERGFIKVDNCLRTNVQNIYAIGDVVGMPMLAHKASKEGEVVAEILSGREVEVDYKCVPAVVYTEPEVAIVGKTENQVKEEGLEVLVGKFPLLASGRALTKRETNGFIKMIADKKTHEIIGVSIVGANASELIGEVALAIEMGAAAEDIAYTIHPHPTMSEALMECAKATIGEPIHIIKARG